MYWYKPNNHWKNYKGQSLKGQRGGLMSRWSACKVQRAELNHTAYLKSHMWPCRLTFNPSVGRGRQGGLQGPAAYQSNSSFSELSFLKRIRQKTIEPGYLTPSTGLCKHACSHTYQRWRCRSHHTNSNMFSYILSSQSAWLNLPNAGITGVHYTQQQAAFVNISSNKILFWTWWITMEL